VTFDGAGTRRVTATLGAATADTEVRVAATAPRGLHEEPADGDALGEGQGSDGGSDEGDTSAGDTGAGDTGAGDTGGSDEATTETDAPAVPDAAASWWIWLLLAVVVAAIAGAITFLLRRRSRAF
jgi:hypothetical protein